MNYVANPVKGIFNITNEFTLLGQSEEIKGLTKKVIFISLLNAVLTALITYFSPDLESQLAQSDVELVGNMKVFVALGAAFFGLILPIITISIYSVLTWILFTDVGFQKIFLVHFYSYLITIVYLISQLFFFFFFNIDPTNSPLSLGIIGESLTNNSYIQSILSSLSIFWVWGIVLQVISLSILSAKSKQYIVISVILLNLLATMGLAAWT
jgi:hypothetical protein